MILTVFCPLLTTQKIIKDTYSANTFQNLPLPSFYLIIDKDTFFSFHIIDMIFGTIIMLQINAKNS